MLMRSGQSREAYPFFLHLSSQYFISKEICSHALKEPSLYDLSQKTD